MSEWKSFATKPRNGQPVIVMHEKEETRYAGMYIEFKKEPYIVMVDDVDTELLSIKTKFLSVRWFTHWKEV